jgi:penicillin amidase
VAKGKELLAKFENWNLRADNESEGQTIFTEWYKELGKMVWLDDITRPDSLPVGFPQAATLLEALLKDTAFVFLDDKHTTDKETIDVMVTQSFEQTVRELDGKPLGWAAFKATGVRHLLGGSLAAFSRLQLPIGGGSNIINAATNNWGPSWRVIVHMTDETEAYGVYPGGQNGNPGSKYYDQFVDQWAKGEYNKLWIIKSEVDAGAKAKWKIHFKPAA